VIGERQAQVDVHLVKGADIVTAEFGIVEKPAAIKCAGFGEAEKAVDLLQRKVAVVLPDELLNGYCRCLAAR